MKNSIYKNLLLILAAGFAATTVVLNAKQIDHHTFKEGKTEEVAFLGVYSTDVSSTLTHQLGFPKGFYLTIQQVEPGSPADEAGLQQHDILQMIDDQIIINADQLKLLIRSKKAGTNVGIQYYRGGKEHTASAKLTTRKVPAQMQMERFHHGIWPKNLPNDEWPRGFNQHSQSFNYDFDTDFKVTGPQNKTFTITNDQTSVQINDDHGSLAFDVKEGKGNLTIRDKEGKTLYDGEYKVGQKLNDLPEHWQKRLKGIDKQLKHHKEARDKQASSKEKSKID
jgi:membrane-associated protease RseP (regulator of RpoE activity)